ncbi:MAG: phage tail tape measure protein [Microgenomates group bacterium]
MGNNENFKVQIDAILGKVNDASVKSWRKTYGSIVVPIKLDLKNSGSLKPGQIKLGLIESVNAELNKASALVEKFKLSTLNFRAPSLGKGQVQAQDLSGLVSDITNNPKMGASQLASTVGNVVLLEKELKNTLKEINVEERTITKEEKEQLRIRERALKSANDLLANSKRYKSSQALSESLGRAEEIKGLNQDLILNPGMPASQIAATTNRIKELNNANADAKLGFEKSTKSARSFGDKLNQVFERFGLFAIAAQVFFAATQELKNGIKYVSDLNKEMVNIQVVSGQTDAQINALAKSYNNLGREMSVSTLDIAKGSLEFVRQGKTAEETAVLIKNSTMLSKLGNMEAAQSSEALTAIMNGFKLSAEETTAVVNKLISIDNIAATSAHELATAMQYSSATAQQVGIDFDHLAAYIGTVSSTTRLSSETIGQAMKTISARMTAIKDMKAFDDEGEAINKVEKSLMEVGVSLRDSNGHFRDMQDVIDELSQKWNSFSKENQMFIAQQIGGVRQQNIVLSLLGNELEIRKQLTAEKNSSGLAEQRYAIYMDSVEAAQSRMKASWEQLWGETLKSEVIQNFYDMSASIIDGITNLGGLTNALYLVLGVLTLIKAQVVNTFMVGILSPVNITLITSLWRNGLMGMITVTNAWAVAIASVLAIVVMFNTEITRRVNEGRANFAASSDSRIDKLKEEELTIKSILKAYSDLINATHAGDGGIGAGMVSNDLQKMRLEALSKIMPLLQETSSSWKEYEKSTSDALDKIGAKLDKNGRIYVEGVGHQRIYIDGLKALTEAEYEHLQWLERVTKDDRPRFIDNITLSAEEATKKLEILAQLISDLGTQGVDLMGKSEAGLTGADIANIPQELKDYAKNTGQDYLRLEGEQIRINTNLLREYTEQELLKEKAMADAALAAKNMSQVEYDAIIMTINATRESLREIDVLGYRVSQGTFLKIAKEQSVAIWKLVQDSHVASVDMGTDILQGADSVYNFMKKYPERLSELIQKLISLNVAGVADMVAQMSGSAAGALGLAGVPSLTDIFGTPSTGGGGGSSSQEKSKEEIRLSAEVDKLNKKKKALQDNLDEFNKWIDAQKESLKLQKEEEDFTDSLLKKNKTLAELKSEIALLSLDTSLEAQAKKIKLEEEASALEEDITKDSEDRKYQLKIDALDKAKREYGNNIDIQLKGIDATILKYQEQIKVIQDVAAAIGAGGTASTVWGILTAQAGTQISMAFASYFGLNDTNKTLLEDQAQLWVDNKANIEDAYWALYDYALLLSTLQNPYTTPTGAPIAGENAAYDANGNRILQPTAKPKSKHSGGFAGEVSGSNEVFARLLKGEYTATSDQMRGFMKGVVPKLIGMGASPEFSPNTNSSVSLSMPITVEGNLDSSVMPNIEKMAQKVIKEINKTLSNRGNLRSANQTIS